MTVGGDYPISPIPFTEVALTDVFWAPRLETNRRATLPYCLDKCEETGRISNFDRAAGVEEGPHQGIYFNDSDVFKVMEGASALLALGEDAELDACLDDLIARVGAAQEEDGYLYTARTIDPSAVNPEEEGPTRWSNLPVNHELYNVGHMYEAAVAHFQATGKRSFLDIALRNADLVADTFGPDGIHDVPGHQEIEIGLVKLYRVTGRGRYLDLARFFLDQRGRHDTRDAVVRFGNPGYLQDHLPVTEQHSAVGHAVRAGYMYAGMADVAALCGLDDYRDTLGALRRDVTESKLYLHGGIGARHEGEAFGDPFELPNDTAYAETCAAIANVYWNHRMFLLEGDTASIDLLELSLYNCALAGVSLSGTEFFYPNPLTSDGEWAFNKGSTRRQPWFDCSCCPTNIVRFLPALPGWIYAVWSNLIYVNLYAGSEASLQMPGLDSPVGIVQSTRYPWDGQVELRLRLAEPTRLGLALRIPGWLHSPAPGSLYEYADDESPGWTLKVNGQESEGWEPTTGHLIVERVWEDGDTLQADWSMPVRRVLCREEVHVNRGREALMRGPLVYCVEAADNPEGLEDLRLGPETRLRTGHDPALQPEAVTIHGRHAERNFTAVPYHLWGHRQAGPMTVWLPAA